MVQVKEETSKYVCSGAFGSEFVCFGEKSVTYIHGRIVCFQGNFVATLCWWITANNGLQHSNNHSGPLKQITNNNANNENNKVKPLQVPYQIIMKIPKFIHI